MIRDLDVDPRPRGHVQGVILILARLTERFWK